MRRAEIDALLRAHKNRAQPVAFFHVLRQPSLEADDHAFLLEHIEELGASDLLRWRARSEKGSTAPVLRKLADLAIREPVRFRHEVLDAPRLGFEEAEWDELAKMLRGKVPDEIFQRVEARNAPAAAPAPTPAAPPRASAEERLSLGDLFDDTAGNAGGDAPRGGAPAGGGELSFFDGLDDGGGDFGFPGSGGAAAEMLKEPPAEDVDWSPSVTRFPPSFRDAILDRARKTPRGDERAVLLEWLAQNEVGSKQLIGLVAESIRADRELSASVTSWLARQFAQRATWEEEGAGVLTALIERRAFTEISDLMTFSLNEAGAANATEAQGGLLSAVEVSFAEALIQVIRWALEADHPARAMAALSALACLGPPARVSEPIHELRRASGVGQEVIDLIDVNERRGKRGDARPASLEDIVAAVHTLADAF